MTLPESDYLNIGKLSSIFDDKAESYKLFWFTALCGKIFEGKSMVTYDELINEMIAEAWYMVTEYHLNLGPSDSLEKIIIRLEEISGLRPCEKKSEIIKFVSSCTDKEVRDKKRNLMNDVPYRLQAPFIGQFDWKRGRGTYIEELNTRPNLIYYYSAFAGLNTEIRISDEWMNYLNSNRGIIEGWIRYNMIIYLQRRNPNVPGLSDKLTPPQERKLTDVMKYWRIVMSYVPIKEIYGKTALASSDKDLSIDHFVPWSYVASDELWNLSPTTKSINSAKSNYLPDWNTYFNPLAEIEYAAYQAAASIDAVDTAFKRCAKEHVNSDEIRYTLYATNMSKQEFTNKLESIIRPVYLSAVNLGFRENWVYGNE